MASRNTLNKMSLANLKKRAEKVGFPEDVELLFDLLEEKQIVRQDVIQFILDNQPDTTTPVSEPIDVVLDTNQVKNEYLEMLRDDLAVAEIHYINEISFPMTHTPTPENPRTFTFASGQILQLNVVGLYYLRMLNRDEIVHSKITDKLEDGDYAWFAELTQHEKFQKKQYIASVWMDSVVGFLTNYHPVATETIIDMIEENGLASDVVSTTHNKYESEIRIGVLAPVSSKLKTFISIKNGHSGHVALAYRAGVQVGGFEFMWKFNTHSRVHLSRISEGVSALTDAIEETAQLKFETKLQAMTFEDAVYAMTGSNLKNSKKFDKFIEEVSYEHFSNGEQLVGWFSSKISEHGRKGITQKALQNIFTYML